MRGRRASGRVVWALSVAAGRRGLPAPQLWCQKAVSEVEDAGQKDGQNDLDGSIAIVIRCIMLSPRLHEVQPFEEGNQGCCGLTLRRGIESRVGLIVVGRLNVRQCSMRTLSLLTLNSRQENK